VILVSTHALQDFADMEATSLALGFLSKSALSADAIRNLVRSSTAVAQADAR
jgi:hypothetical protein